MENKENNYKSIKINDDTYSLVIENKGNKTAIQFIDEAIRQYVRSLDLSDPLTRISKELDVISERQTTNLGLLCEVLRQAGILNGNGEITFEKRVNKS